MALMIAFAIWPLTPIAYALRASGRRLGESETGTETETETWRRQEFRERGTSFSIFLLLAVAANLFAFWFVSSEGSYTYFWDWARYWTIYREESSLIKSNPIAGIGAALSSIRVEDYNTTPILPLAPIQWIFGSGRIPYILAVVDLLLLPSALLLAVAARQIQPNRSAASLGLATSAILCLHALWAPALRGLPDVLGVGIIGLILCIYFSAPLTDQRPVRLAIIGLLLCLLALTRRYYLFWIAAFLPSALLTEWIRLYRTLESRRIPKIISATGRVAIIYLIFLSSIIIFAPDLIIRIFFTDYADMYSAYRNSATILDAAHAAVGYFGWATVAFAATGLILLLVHKQVRYQAFLIILQAAIIFALFTHTQDFGIQHYYLLLPALALGVAALVFALWTGVRSRRLRVGGMAAIFLALIASSASVLIPGAVGGALLPTARLYPLVRRDLGAINQLMDRLSQLPGAGKIYVLSSSPTLNYSTLQVACRVQDRPKALCDRILRTHDVDKRDGFPERFLEASYVVLSTPPQYHLRPRDQQAIGLLAEAVIQGRGVGSSLKPLPAQFQLEHGVRVQIYAKTAEFSRDDVTALKCRFYDSYPSMRSPAEGLNCGAHSAPPPTAPPGGPAETLPRPPPTPAETPRAEASASGATTR